MAQRLLPEGMVSPVSLDRLADQTPEVSKMEKIRRWLVSAYHAINPSPNEVAAKNIKTDNPQYNYGDYLWTKGTLEPTPTPTPQPYRNPQMDYFRTKDPQSYSEIESGVNLATTEPLKRALMMDMALEESGMRVNPPPNPKSTAKGAYQFIDQTAREQKVNPLSATDSARVVNRLLDRQLLHWWETLRKGGATKTPLDQLYSAEELNQFLLPKYQE